MPLNKHPLRQINQEDIETYARDGVVCLRKVFDPEWIEPLKPLSERIIIKREDFGLLPTYHNRYMSRCIPEFRKFIFESPLAEACGKAIGSREVRFYFDELFAKPPRSDASTPWHTDRMGWPVDGVMVPSLWIPMTPITKSNSLECIAGSFKYDARYWLFGFNARQMIQPPDRLSHPDGEALRSDPRVRFLTWDMDPGDMLIVHPWCLHYSAGNPTDEWRHALSVRIFGDDITWNPRPDCVNLAGICWDEMIAGERPAGPLFPLLWSTSGDHDSDDLFPRGFAANWRKGVDGNKIREGFNAKLRIKNENGGLSKIDVSSFVNDSA